MDVSRLQPERRPEQIDFPTEDLLLDKLDSDLEDLDIEDAEEASRSEEEKRRKKNQKRPTYKKRRSVSSQALSQMYEHDSDSQNPTDVAAKKSLTRKMGGLHQKIKQGFQEQLKEQLSDSMHKKAAALISDKAIIKQQAKAPDATTLEDTPMRSSDSDSQQKKVFKKEKQQRAASLQQMIARPDTQLPLKNYVTAYAESMLKQSNQSKTKQDKLRHELRSMGVSQRHLSQIEKGTHSIIGNDIKKMLKRNFINLALSYQKKDNTESLRKFADYHSVLDVAKQARLFNAYPDSFKNMKNSAKEEMGSFLTGELDRSLIETKLKSNSVQDLMKVFDSFNNLASFVKFNANDYMRTFQQKIENEGLNAFIAPTPPGSLDTDRDGQSGKQQDSPESISEHDDAQDPETALLNAYIKGLLSPSFLDKIKHKLSIRSQEKSSGLSKNKQKTIQENAKAIALLRASMDCRRLFEERATLEELRGPEYQRFKSELKRVLKMLKSLGKPYTKTDLQHIQDQSNRSIFGYIKEDYIKNNVFLESQPNNGLLKANKKRFLKILKRIQQETSIKEDISPKLMQDLHFLDDVNIVEAA